MVVGKLLVVVGKLFVVVCAGAIVVCVGAIVVCVGAIVVCVDSTVVCIDSTVVCVFMSVFDCAICGIVSLFEVYLGAYCYFIPFFTAHVAEWGFLSCPLPFCSSTLPAHPGSLFLRICRCFPW